MDLTGPLIIGVVLLKPPVTKSGSCPNFTSRLASPKRPAASVAADGRPASCYLTLPMIYSSLDLDLFIIRLQFVGRILLNIKGILRSQVSGKTDFPMSGIWMKF